MIQRSFYNFDSPVICATVLLGHLIDVVTLDDMLLIKIYIVYHDFFVGLAVVFDRVHQLSDFTV